MDHPWEGIRLSKGVWTYAAFILSGAAGLAYEVLWGRYLGLFVGHSAYAQVLVLSVYLGGMGVGALSVGDLSKRLRSPLLWYAGVEIALALFGIAFHTAFQAITDVAYDSIFPALPGASWVGAARWGLAGLLILPQSVLLGTTFPLMAAGLVRRDTEHPGRGVATAYLANSLGAAGGILATGFWAIAWWGLPGTSLAAAGLNLGAALLIFLALARSPDPAESADPAAAGGPSPESAAVEGDHDLAGLTRLLLAVSFGTAVASFGYEIAWIRMLSLVLGSATHSFELMLSAFILGLALGAWLIRDWADRAGEPLRLLGGIQVVMGLAALATLPLYLGSFEVMGMLVRDLPGRDGGYLIFNLGRYVICLAVMLPSTIMAGMTLPIITGTLLRAGCGERAIGRVYGFNTIGSVCGAGVAGLVALPALGLQGLLIVAATLDVALGAWLLARSARTAKLRYSFVGTTALVGGLAAVLAMVWFPMDALLLGSGVFRTGSIPGEDEREVLFAKDGRTATVSVHLSRGTGLVVLSTNGKPDASMGPRWFIDGRDTLPLSPIPGSRDFTTQVMAPLVAAAFVPELSNAANIGHGSGMSGVALLANPTLERMVTVEIEPAMVEGSFGFLPNNERVFNDPRSTFVFDDAKSFFAANSERFDLIFAEPSNPWVSGSASLFTKEFYHRIRDYLSDGGVVGQWVQIYELDDDLFLSVLKALDQEFPYYQAYLVGDADVAIVASLQPLREPDWSVFALEGVQQVTVSVPPFEPEHLASLFLFDQETFRPLLDGDLEANSDFDPILDLGAERARFEGTMAVGLLSFAANRLDLRRALGEIRQEPMPHRLVPTRGLVPAVNWGRAAWLREAMVQRGGIAPEQYPEWSEDLLDLRDFLFLTGSETPPDSWWNWAAAFARSEQNLHWGTAGWAEEGFYRAVFAFLDRASAPSETRAAVDLMYGVSTFDWSRVASAADVLLSPVALGERWVRPTVLLDAAVIGYLKTGRADDARRALATLTDSSGRAPGNLRNRYLDILIEKAEAGSGP
jgi:predicted membrane-bound spermidine synthase